MNDEVRKLILEILGMPEDSTDADLVKELVLLKNNQNTYIGDNPWPVFPPDDNQPYWPTNPWFNVNHNGGCTTIKANNNGGG